MAEIEAKLATISETRNSWLRDRTKEPIIALTKVIHKQLPWLSPTHITILGALEVAAGAIIAAARNPKRAGGEKGKTAAAASLIVKGSAMDALDGTLARLKGAEDPQSVNFKRGQVYDALSDRFQEGALAESRANYAAKRGGLMGWIGEKAAIATSVTGSWTSISRAFSESRGIAVPESGKGVFGLAGTRPGRAVLGSIATLYPEPKGLPVQPVADIIMTASNIVTTIDRLGTAFSGKKPSLSREVREDASNRLKFLTAFALVSTGFSLFSYMRRHRNQEQEAQYSGDADFVKVISAVEQYCREQGLDHRFVGGAVTDLIGPKSKFYVDVTDKIYTVFDFSKPTLKRSDNTVKDIDLVVFTADRAKFIKAREDFNGWQREAQKRGIFFPKISIEAAKHPDWPKRSMLKQFVSAFGVDPDGNPYLAFCGTKKSLKPKSIESWTLRLGNNINLTTFNPVAHALCYHLRVPSGVKRKDKEIIGNYERGTLKPFSKLSLAENLALYTIKRGEDRGIDYASLYTDWLSYIEALAKKPDLQTRVKKIITGLYWNTIGTDVAHGKGIFKGLSEHGDMFPG